MSVLTSIWAIYYVPGYGLYKGTSQSNNIIARDILKQLEGLTEIPTYLVKLINDLNQQYGQGWRIVRQ